MTTAPRVAFFTDSFGEVNGVARTSRALVDFASARQLPVLAVHAGDTTGSHVSGSVRHLALARGPLSFGLEKDMRFDLRLWRYREMAARALHEFQPDLVHITGPSDVGQLGAFLAHSRRLPVIASWHTNLHDFAALRLARLLRWLPASLRAAISEAARHQALRLALDFYRIARRILAPNAELAEMIQRATGIPTDLMSRGVETALFDPARRARRDATFRLGYVGRLSPEKNVRLLVEIEHLLEAWGCDDFTFLIVGEGSERRWLESAMKRADFAGVLTGERLAAAYASMDLFVFPSDSDTFGNVVLEAFASGVPAAVIDRGGPKFLVTHGVNGFVASDAEGLSRAARELMADDVKARQMRASARERAMQASWDRVFEGVWESYRRCLSDPVPEVPRARLTGAARLITTALKAFRRRGQADRGR